MNIEVKNSVKPVDYVESIKILESRAEDVFLDKKNEETSIGKIEKMSKSKKIYITHLLY